MKCVRFESKLVWNKLRTARQSIGNGFTSELKDEIEIENKA